MDCTCDRSSPFRCQCANRRANEAERLGRSPYAIESGGVEKAFIPDLSRGLIPVLLGSIWSFQLPTSFCRTVEDHIQCGPIHSLDFEVSTFFAPWNKYSYLERAVIDCRTSQRCIRLWSNLPSPLLRSRRPPTRPERLCFSIWSFNPYHVVTNRVPPLLGWPCRIRPVLWLLFRRLRLAHYAMSRGSCRWSYARPRRYAWNILRHCRHCVADGSANPGNNFGRTQSNGSDCFLGYYNSSWVSRTWFLSTTWLTAQENRVVA
jgi:hypothetical protein